MTGPMLNRITVISLFPDWFDAFMAMGLTGKALSEGRVELQCINPRDFAQGVHRSVDDRPYGGGPGMVMRPEPLALAIEHARSDPSDIVSGMSPQGARLNQSAVESLALREQLILVCGRYEGIDERVNEALIDEEWSLGDYVLSGGEYAAAVLMDAVLRLQPGVLGHCESAAQDSFTSGLLDYPHYTRPPKWRGRLIPEVLQSGDHSAIEAWRRQQALKRTLERRPDLLTQTDLSDQDRALLATLQDSGTD